MGRFGEYEDKRQQRKTGTTYVVVNLDSFPCPSVINIHTHQSFKSYIYRAEVHKRIINNWDATDDSKIGKESQIPVSGPDLLFLIKNLKKKTRSNIYDEQNKKHNTQQPI